MYPLAPVSFLLLALAANLAVADLQPFTEEIKVVDPGANANLKFEMLPIKGGTFLFAVDKAPPKKLEIKSFWMAKTECTWDLYYVFWYQFDLPRNQRNLKA